MNQQHLEKKTSVLFVRDISNPFIKKWINSLKSGLVRQRQRDIGIKSHIRKGIR